MGKLRDKVNGRWWQILTSGFALAALVAAVTAASSWGGLEEKVLFHVEPSNHAGIVLAGDAQAAERLTRVETAQEAVTERVGELAEQVENLRQEQSDAAGQRGEMLGILKTLRDRSPHEPRRPPE